MLIRLMFAILFVLAASLTACGGAADAASVQSVCGAIADFETDSANDPILSLSFRNGQSQSLEISDAGKISEIYRALKNIPLGETRGDPGIDDAEIVFEFRRGDGGSIALSFVTADYFKTFSDGKTVFYAVSDTNAVQNCVESAVAAGSVGNGSVANGSVANGSVANGSVANGLTALDPAKINRIDMDGDGNDESIDLIFTDNGDEALGSLEISITAGSEVYSANFYPAAADATGIYSVPRDDRTILAVTTAELVGWPSQTCFIALDGGKFGKCVLENVGITEYRGGTFILSDGRELNPSELNFDFDENFDEEPDESEEDDPVETATTSPATVTGERTASYGDYAVEPYSGIKLNASQYDGGYFTMLLPDGWSVKTVGRYFDSGVLAYDTQVPERQIFYYCHIVGFLKSEAAKSELASYASSGPSYAMRAEFPVMANGTAEEFFLDYPSLMTACDKWNGAESDSSHYPDMSGGVEVLEKFP